MKHLLALIVMLLCNTTSTSSHAHDAAPPRYDQVRLSASAAKEVDTDTVVAMVAMERQAQTQAGAADEVNRAIAWAVERAKAAGVEVETATYRSFPVYVKQQLTGWRVTQSIRLESDDASRMSKLLAELQSRLSLQSLRNLLSPQARADAEEALTEQALEAFARRAKRIAASLGRDGYRIVEINIGTSGAGPRPAPMRATAMGSARVAAPSIEAGMERVEVRIDGSIELDAAH